MMDTMETTTNTNTSVVGIGARLRAARESLNLSEKEVAARLHLSIKFIHQMENEDFHGDTPVTFLRGYLRSYGKILNLSEKEILEGINQLGIETNPPKTFTPMLNTPITNNNEQYIKWITYLVGIVLVALVAIWWSSHPKDNDANKALGTTSATTPDTDTEKNTTATTDTTSGATPDTTSPNEDQDFGTHPFQIDNSPSSNKAALEKTPTDQTVNAPKTPAEPAQSKAADSNQPSSQTSFDEMMDSAATDEAIDEQETAAASGRKQSSAQPQMSVPEPGLDTSDF